MPGDPRDPRSVLLEALERGHEVVVHYQRNGQPSATRGKVVSVTPTHAIVAWSSGAGSDTTIPIASIRHVSRIAA